jgi:hypothetical protein
MGCDRISFLRLVEREYSGIQALSHGLALWNGNDFWWADIPWSRRCNGTGQA